MTSSTGLRGWSRLQARRGVLQTTMADDDRRQRALLGPVITRRIIKIIAITTATTILPWSRGKPWSGLPYVGLYAVNSATAVQDRPQPITPSNIVVNKYTHILYSGHRLPSLSLFIITYQKSWDSFYRSEEAEGLSRSKTESTSKMAETHA